ncbi:MAG: ABC1 kinase family protein [Limisphaerales bacterium]
MVKPAQGPVSFLGRGFRLGKLGLSVTGSYLGYQAQNLFLSEEAGRGQRRRFEQTASRRLRQELELLKGPAMKLGQILSMHTQMLPESALRELASLQMQAPPMHPTLARAQFKAVCGKFPEEVFRHFEADPFAAASLGQVHRAVTRRGETVAVKLQYPAIRTAIENDFKLLRSVTLPGRLTGYVPVSLLDEVRRGFLEETDYLREARNLEFFRQGLSGYPWLAIPRVYWEHTTERLLTMSFIEGSGLADFLAAKPSQAVRDLVGGRLFELFHFQLQRLRSLHADHHPGNFLFTPDGGVGLVDFGCVKRVTIDAPGICRACIRRAWRQDRDQAQYVCRQIFGPRPSFSQTRPMLASLEELADILFPEAAGAGARVDFGDAQLLAVLVRSLRSALRHKLANPEFAFVSRTELGLYSLLHELGARVDTRAVCERVAQLPDQRVRNQG